MRPARVRQPHQLGGLVEGLAGGIVQGFAQQLVIADAAHIHQLRMAARHQQCHERRLRRVLFQQRRQQMPFHVVHADGRHFQRERQRPSRRRAHQQRTHQPRAGGIGHTVDIRQLQPGLRQALAHQRHQLAHMVAAGQFRHHAAVIGVHRHLAVERVRTQAGGGVVHRDAGFIATGFDAEDDHGSFRAEGTPDSTHRRRACTGR